MMHHALMTIPKAYISQLNGIWNWVFFYRFHWWSSKGRRNLQENWSLMVSTSPSSLRMMTLRASGTDWSWTHRMRIKKSFVSYQMFLDSGFFINLINKLGPFLFPSSFPNNYWDKFVKRKVSSVWFWWFYGGFCRAVSCAIECLSPGSG